MNSNTPPPFFPHLNGLTSNKKIFQIHSLLAPSNELGRAQPYPHPSFLKQEVTEIWEVSKLLKVSASKCF